MRKRHTSAPPPISLRFRLAVGPSAFLTDKLVSGVREAHWEPLTSILASSYLWVEMRSVVLKVAIVVRVLMATVSPAVTLSFLSESSTFRSSRVTIAIVGSVKWSIESEETPEETQYMMNAWIVACGRRAQRESSRSVNREEDTERTHIQWTAGHAHPNDLVTSHDHDQ